MSQLMRYGIRSRFLLFVGAVALGLILAYNARIALIVIVGIVIFLAVHAYPAETIVALLVWLPFEQWALKFLPLGSALLSIPDITSFILLMVIIERMRSKRNANSNRTVHFSLSAVGPPFLLLVAAVLSLMVNQPSTIDVLYWFRINFRFVPIAFLMADDDIRVKIVRWLPGIGIFVVLTESFIGFMEYFGGESVARFFWPGQFFLGGITSQSDTLASVGDKLVGGTLGHYNAFALLLIIWLSILLGHASAGLKDASFLRRGFYVFVLCAGIIAILISQSRQGLAILGIVLVFWFFSLKQISRQVRVMGFSIGALLLVLSSGVFDVGIQGLMQRLASLKDSSFWMYQVSKNRGYAVTNIANAVSRRSPILGMGPGSFTNNTGAVSGSFGVSELGLSQANSNFIGDVGWANVFSQLGLLGVSAVIWMIASSLAHLRRLPRSSTLAIGGFAVAMVLTFGMMASTPLIYKGTSSLIWVIFGLLGASMKDFEVRKSVDI